MHMCADASTGLLRRRAIEQAPLRILRSLRVEVAPEPSSLEPPHWVVFQVDVVHLKPVPAFGVTRFLPRPRQTNTEDDADSRSDPPSRSVNSVRPRCLLITLKEAEVRNGEVYRAGTVSNTGPHFVEAVDIDRRWCGRYEASKGRRSASDVYRTPGPPRREIIAENVRELLLSAPPQNGPELVAIHHPPVSRCPGIEYVVLDLWWRTDVPNGTEVNNRPYIEESTRRQQEIPTESPTREDWTNVLAGVRVDPGNADVAGLHSGEVVDHDLHVDLTGGRSPSCCPTCCGDTQVPAGGGSVPP